MQAPSKDFELSLRLRNNHLKKRRSRLGLNQAQMAERIGVGHCTYAMLESLRASPLRARPAADGEAWKDTAKKIAAYFGCKEDELWPGAVLAVTVPEVVVEVGIAELLPPEAASALLPEAAPSPEDAAQTTKAGSAVRDALALLPEAEAQVLRLRFGIDVDGGPLDLVEVGRLMPKENGQPKSRERVRQIEARAMQRLRQSQMGEHLHSLAEELPGTMPWRPAPPATPEQRALNVRSAMGSLNDYLGYWAQAHRRPRIMNLWQAPRNLISDALRQDSTLRGVAIDQQASVQLTSDVGIVAQWAEAELPDVADNIREFKDEAVFFVLISDADGLQVFRTGLQWDNGEEEE